MSMLDDAKAKMNEAGKNAKDMADKASDKADIMKQRMEGEADKMKGDNVKGEAKVKASQLRDGASK